MTPRCDLLFNDEDGQEAAPASNSVFNLHYGIFDVPLFDDAYILLASTAPVTVRGYPRSVIGPIERINDTTWKGHVTYSNQGSFDPGTSEYSFDTGGGTFKRLFAIEHLYDGSVGNLATNPRRNHEGAIGVHEDQVEGVEVPIPVYNWSESYEVSPSVLTTTYKRNLFMLTGCMNNAPFKGFAKGEVLFLGAQGSQRGYGPVKLAFKFSSLPNATNITVRPGLSLDFKYGWDYMWVEFTPFVEGREMTRKPTHIHNERVVPFANFSLLNIGT